MKDLIVFEISKGCDESAMQVILVAHEMKHCRLVGLTQAQKCQNVMLSWEVRFLAPK
jgi:hypothetical protein